MPLEDGDVNGESDVNDTPKSSSSRSLFDSFYQHFVLRDLFGKVIPGLIVLFAIASLLFDPLQLKELVPDLSTMAWLALIGVGWLSGFVIQSIGEASGLILYYPQNRFFYRPFRSKNAVSWAQTLQALQSLGETNNASKQRAMREYLRETEFASQQEYFQFLVPVLHACDPKQSTNIERLVVIKEACGNGYVSLLITSLAFFSNYAVAHGRPGQLGTGAAVLFMAALFLARMHFEHVRRQQYYSSEVVNTNHWRA